jgi:ubiquinone/menaquinone biosynthesis C-methylase UbiE
LGIYAKYFLPRLLNSAMKAPAMSSIRARLVPLAKGRVLEIGIGSGLNLPFYQKDVSVVGIDPSLELQTLARGVADDANLDVQFIAQSAESIPAESNSFDCAVLTWTLCTIPDPEQALNEIHRVLKPGSKVIFAEHGRSPDAQVARWQDRVNPFWNVIGGGCNLNRPMGRLIGENGFKFEAFSEGYDIPGPRIATYTYSGVAIAR